MSSSSRRVPAAIAARCAAGGLEHPHADRVALVDERRVRAHGCAGPGQRDRRAAACRSSTPSAPWRSSAAAAARSSARSRGRTASRSASRSLPSASTPPLVVLDAERHAQVRRQPRRGPSAAAGRARRAAPRAARASASSSGAPRAARSAVEHARGDGLGHGHERAPQLLRQRADQRRHELLAAAPGTSQSKPSGRSCEQRLERDVDGHAVVRRARARSGSVSGSVEVALLPRRPAAPRGSMRGRRGVATSSSRVNVSRSGLAAARVAPPAVEVRGRTRRRPGSARRRSRTAPRRRRGCRAGARGPRAPRPPRRSARLAAKNAWRVSQSPSTSAWRMNSSRDSVRVDAAVGDACGRRRSAGRTASPARWRRPSRARAPSAARRSVRLTQVPGERLDPARVDPRGRPPPQPRRLDQLGDHHPRRLLPRQRRAGEDREARAARAQVLAAGGVAQPEVREQPGEQRACGSSSRLGRRRG